MKSNKFFSKIISGLPLRSNYIFWLLLALIIKSLFFSYKVSFEHRTVANENYKETFAMEGGDSYSYFEPVDNYISSGKYYGKIYEDYRMPGYGAIYFILCKFFSVPVALNILVLLQLLLSAISVYVLASISFSLFRSDLSFYLTYFLYLISTYVSLYDPLLLSESFCCSALIIGIYFLLNHKSSKWNLLLAGIFFAWCVFLRPIMFPLLGIACFVLMIDMRNTVKRSVFQKLKLCFVFLIPFVITDGLWIVSNYKKYDRIIPLTKSKYYPNIEDSYWAGLLPFINAIGGSHMFWQPGSEMSFFIDSPGYIDRKVIATLPDNIYTSKFNLDSLNMIRQLIKEADAPTLDSAEKNALINTINSKMYTYTTSIQVEKPYLFYFGSRIKALKAFFIHSGTYNLFNKASYDLTTIEYLLKLFYSILYLIVIVGGFIGSFMLITKGIKLPHYLLISLIAFYLALVFPLGLKVSEYRYFVPGYPIFCIATVYVIISFVNRINTKKVNA